MRGAAVEAELVRQDAARAAARRAEMRARASKRRAEEAELGMLAAERAAEVEGLSVLRELRQAAAARAARTRADADQTAIALACAAEQQEEADAAAFVLQAAAQRHARTRASSNGDGDSNGNSDGDGDVDEPTLIATWVDAAHDGGDEYGGACARAGRGDSAEAEGHGASASGARGEGNEAVPLRVAQTVDYAAAAAAAQRVNAAVATAAIAKVDEERRATARRAKAEAAKRAKAEAAAARRAAQEAADAQKRERDRAAYEERKAQVKALIAKGKALKEQEARAKAEKEASDARERASKAEAAREAAEREAEQRAREATPDYRAARKAVDAADAAKRAKEAALEAKMRAKQAQSAGSRAKSLASAKMDFSGGFSRSYNLLAQEDAVLELDAAAVLGSLYDEDCQSEDDGDGNDDDAEGDQESRKRRVTQAKAEAAALARAEKQALKAAKREAKVAAKAAAMAARAKRQALKAAANPRKEGPMRGTSAHGGPSHGDDSHRSLAGAVTTQRLNRSRIRADKRPGVVGGSSAGVGGAGGASGADGAGGSGGAGGVGSAADGKSHGTDTIQCCSIHGGCVSSSAASPPNENEGPPIEWGGGNPRVQRRAEAWRAGGDAYAEFETRVAWPPTGDFGYADCLAMDGGDGTVLCMGSDGDATTVATYTAAAGPDLCLIGHTAAVCSVATNGNLFASGSLDRTIKLWSQSTGLEVAVLDCDASPLGLAMSADWLICGEDVAEGESSAGGRVLLWPIGEALKLSAIGATPAVQMVEHAAAVVSVAISERCCASAGSSDLTARVWPAAYEKGTTSLAALPHEDGVTSVALNWAGSMLATGCIDGHVYVWSTVNFAKLARIDHSATRAAICSVRLAADLLVSGCRDGYVKLWSLTECGELITTLRPFADEGTEMALAIQGVAISTIDGIIAVAGDDRLVLYRPASKAKPQAS